MGARNSNTRELAAPDLTMSNTVCASRPALRPSTIASALATLLMATRRLATYFMRLPLPNPAARCIAVLTRAPPARSEEVARERTAHDAEADDTDFALRHCQPPNALCPLIPAHSASKTRVNALMLGIHNRLLGICDLGPHFGGDERM